MRKMKESANAKYMIRVSVKLDGQARRKDIIGAIFGQTEGLMPDALDLRKLQRSGRIGHIDVNLDDNRGKVSGVIEIPSSLENVESAIIGAALETIERIGPAASKLKVLEITNIRSSKRNLMVDRAKDLLLDIVRQRDTDATGLIDEVRSVLTTSEVTTYKDTGMTCGPNVEDSDALIIVEGRNDVMNLASCGIKNVIAVMGAGVDESLTTLVESKSMVKAFLDGDRGGRMIALELSGVLGKKLTHIAFAPEGREVEHLEKKLIGKHLGQAEPASKAISKIQASEGDITNSDDVEVSDEIKEWAENMPGKANQAVFILEDGSATEPIPAKDIVTKAGEIEGVQAVIIKSKGTEKLMDRVSESGIEIVIVPKAEVDAHNGVTIYAIDNF
ncbi:MAG TPA: toprim domain-containing protein [Candidatus Poseidoniales archaeon]|jgi:DNA primase|nr:MAG TPA: toprim domain-containing protein [Candidatus Poseidoniales archaeon]|tara:strand:- start:1168 stop:2331 length:1164 start_codon:yes stop_codon:yes gene_type:complete